MSAAIDAAPVNAAPATDRRDARVAWTLTAPALMLFIGVLLIPLAMTVLLSFHDWGQYKGIEPVFVLKNMLAPIVVVCLVAFTPEGYPSLPTTGFSLRWFRTIANYPEFVHAFWVSLGLGALSSFVSRLFAVPAALAIARYRFRGRDTLAALFLSPLMIPHVVLGIAFPRVFTSIGMGGSFAGLLVAHVVVVFPFAPRLTLAAATGMDR